MTLVVYLIFCKPILFENLIIFLEIVKKLVTAVFD